MPLTDPAPGVRPAFVRRFALRTAAAAASAMLLAGCAAGGAGDDSAANSDNRYVGGDGTTTSFAPDERHEAPTVEGTDLDGEPIALSDYEGDIVVVNFWASWCAPCRAESPVLEEIHKERQDDGVQFLGVNIRDDITAAQAFERKQDITFPSIHDKKGTIAQSFRDTVPPSAIPSTIIIDREGRIAARVIGATNYNGLNKLVKPLLKEGGKGADTDAGA